MCGNTYFHLFEVRIPRIGMAGLYGIMLTLQEIANLFSIVVVSIYIPSSRVRAFQLLDIFFSYWGCQGFVFSNNNRYVMISHFSFKLHFFDASHSLLTKNCLKTHIPKLEDPCGASRGGPW